MFTIRDVKETDREVLFAMEKEFYEERRVTTRFRKKILRQHLRNACAADSMREC